MQALDKLTIPPKDFGDGWMTKSAQDLCKIAIAFGGFDAGEIVLAVTKLQKKRDGKANLATVEKALQMIYEAHEPPEEKKLREEAYAALMKKIYG